MIEKERLSSPTTPRAPGGIAILTPEAQLPGVAMLSSPPTGPQYPVVLHSIHCSKAVKALVKKDGHLLPGHVGLRSKSAIPIPGRNSQLGKSFNILAAPAVISHVGEGVRHTAVSIFRGHVQCPSQEHRRSIATQIRAEIADVPTAFEAWDDLLRAGNGWTYETGENPDGSIWLEKHEYKFCHPLVETVARRLGWPARFPDCENDVADRAHFFRAYESATGKINRTETQLPAVTEYIEKERDLLLDDRRAALDTGEAKEIGRQFRMLARSMER